MTLSRKSESNMLSFLEIPVMNVYFSDFFHVSPDILEDYGAFNISLINDLPLFIDPFLLFNSKKPEYQQLHNEILKYVLFLKEMSSTEGLNQGLLYSWYLFPEIKQNWLGYSKIGNGGSGLGKDFANALHRNLGQVVKDFGQETITKGSHLEKLCLIKDGVGRDNISDFTTNLIKHFLLEYTQTFAQQYIDPSLRKIVPVRNVSFDYDTNSWISAKYDLPYYYDDYVLLTPKDILTKDDTWINKHDIIGDFQDILSSIPNEHLRAQINYYFSSRLPKPTKKNQKPSQRQIADAISSVIRAFPEFIDYYIRYKEENGNRARTISSERVIETENLFIHKLNQLIHTLVEDTDFYIVPSDTLDEAYQRVLFFKDVIENKDGYRIFYIDGVPIKKEYDLQIMFRLTWFASHSDVNREVNNGRGPVDFKISRGSDDKTLVEFKLASNSKLRQNLENQIPVYEAANNTKKSIKGILYFSTEEYQKTYKILQDLKQENNKYVILIDARNDNKPSASKA